MSGSRWLTPGAFRRDPAYSHFRINSVTPGYIATDLNNHEGNRTVEQGARIVVEMATLGPEGPSGGFFNDGPNHFSNSCTTEQDMNIVHALFQSQAGMRVRVWTRSNCANGRPSDSQRGFADA